MKMKNSYLVILLFLAMVFGAILTYAGIEILAEDEVKQDDTAKEPIVTTDEEKKALLEATLGKNEFSKIQQAYTIIQENYLEDVDQQQLIEGAIQGMLNSLDDPHSVYMDLETVEQFNDSIESSFEGIGAEVNMEEGVVTIVAPIKGSPAEEAGLKPKDQILSVDGESLEGLDLYEAVAKIRGEKGSVVDLEIRRPGVSETMIVEVVRDDIPLETIYSSTKTVDGKKTGVIQITSFSQDTAADFNKALQELEADNIEGLIIDVRGNPGGLFTSVEEILENFIPEDQPYVLIEQKNGEKIRYFSGTKEKKDYPIAVLTNNGSASASEILAAAMKEAGYDVIGEQSYGKGTVQKTIPMNDGSNIKITIYKWLTPSGEWIDEKGVAPTVEAKQPDFFYTTPINVEEPLKYNMAEDQISNAQIMLQGIGYKTGRTDGYFSKETEEAVKAFQQENGLTVTGEIDKLTAEKLQQQVLEAARDEENDLQMKKALEILY
ncbi:carboxyl-terminal processing protease [Salirhabdus euzebyi]|uniref:C-terminal processing peptidase n=2 Tax=Salirhabdus euzebyi TaxID=394506 RepID=A0A841Q5C3_9BACI|nr:carboxyl-terminal processing protease [Salirhabdus euzebyi]